jgi:hypothetical protein
MVPSTSQPVRHITCKAPAGIAFANRSAWLPMRPSCQPHSSQHSTPAAAAGGGSGSSGAGSGSGSGGSGSGSGKGGNSSGDDGGLWGAYLRALEASPVRGAAATPSCDPPCPHPRHTPSSKLQHASCSSILLSNHVGLGEGRGGRQPPFAILCSCRPLTTSTCVPHSLFLLCPTCLHPPTHPPTHPPALHSCW